MSHSNLPNETGDDAGQRFGLVVKSRLAFRYWPGVAQFHRSAA